MDEYLIDQVLEGYNRIEAQILGFSQWVPLISENENLKAPIFTTCILDACGLLDSFFRGFLPDPVNINGQQKGRRDCNIEDYANLYSQNLDLPNTRSLMLISPPRFRSPFEKWSRLNPSQPYIPLPWWQAHTSLKHDRLVYMEKATLGVALDCVCALHQVIARICRIEIIQLLIRRNWMTTSPYFASSVRKDLERPSGKLSGVFIIQSKLFAVPVGEFHDGPLEKRKFQFPSDLSGIPLGRLACKSEFRDLLAFEKL